MSIPALVIRSGVMLRGRPRVAVFLRMAWLFQICLSPYVGILTDWGQIISFN